jgi:hypothetical protein
MEGDFRGAEQRFADDVQYSSRLHESGKWQTVIKDMAAFQTSSLAATLILEICQVTTTRTTHLGARTGKRHGFCQGP